MRICRKSVRVTNEFRGEHFTARVDGRFMLTPLALVLLLIDVMDLIFAVDSIPAVFAITQDIFIIYTSNICAILGLRSLYFLLAKLVDRFIYLKTGISILLGFIGLKMILADVFQIPNVVSLGHHHLGSLRDHHRFDDRNKAAGEGWKMNLARLTAKRLR